MARPPLPSSARSIRVDRRALLELLIPHILSYDPSLLTKFLAIPNKLFREVLLSNSFAKLEIHIPTDISSSSLVITKKVNAVLMYSTLSRYVSEIRVSHPTTKATSSTQTTTWPIDREDAEDDRVAVWKFASRLVTSCPQLISLDWNIGFGVDQSSWDAIGSAAALRHLRITHPEIHPNQDPLLVPSYPRISPKQPSTLPRTIANKGDSMAIPDRPTVPDGSWGLGPGWEHLETLQLGPLNETGVKTVSAYLKSPHAVNIQSLALESHLLDALLCHSIGKLGSRGVLTHVELSSTGTRLTAELLKGIIESCVSLENLKLDDVEGHLSKNTWSSIEDWPSRFSSLEIVIRDYSKHKSWTLDHLASIHEVPFTQLRHFAVKRSVHPVNLLPFPPDGARNAPPTIGMELKLIPDALLEIILQNGNHLESLCLDWWEITGQQLLTILTAHSELKIVEVALGAALGFIMSIMPKTLGTSSLQRMVISTDPGVHPPAQTVTKSRVPYVNHADSDLPQRLHDKINAPDPNLPDIKELRKLAGRLPRLLQLVWTGPGGRGHWTFNRKPKSSLIGVSFVHSAVKTRDIWERCQESAPCFDYPDIIEERSTVTGLDASVAPCQCPDSVSSTPVMQEPLLARSTTDGPESAMRLPRSPVATLRPNSPVGADSNLARRRDATPSKSMKHEPRHQSRRVSEPISHDRTNRKSTSNKRDNLGLTTPPPTARVEVNRSPTSTSQPTTPISPTGQLRSPAPSCPVVPSQRGRGAGGGGRGHQAIAAIRTRHISESASAASYLASATSASDPVPSVSSSSRIVPGSGGRSAPAIDALGRVNAARPPFSSPPTKSHSSTSRSSLPGQSSAASGTGRGTANDDGWTVVGGLTKPISKSQVKAEDKKDDKGNAKMKVKVGLKESKDAKALVRKA